MKAIKFIFQVTILFSSFNLFCQGHSTLGVGKKAPTLSVLKWIKGNPVTHWQPGHFYLVEFGATWCKPCIAAIPELSDIQNLFSKDLTVISLFVMESNDNKSKEFPSYVPRVEAFVNKRSNVINYTVGVDTEKGDLQHSWLAAARLDGIPHMFIVDGEGMIRWIGGNTNRAKEVVAQLMRSNRYVASVEENVPKEALYDPAKLLLIENNGGGETDFLFRSVLTRYDGKIFGYNVDHIISFRNFKPDSIYDKEEDKLELIGYQLAKLYYVAYADTFPNMDLGRYFGTGPFPDTLKTPHSKNIYGKYWHEAVLEVSDTRPFKFQGDSPKNRFNYSLKVPKGSGSAQYLQELLRKDLAGYFGYKVEVQKRMMPYWKLSAPDKSIALSKLKSKNQAASFAVVDHEDPYLYKNAIMRDITIALSGNYGFGSLDYGKLPVSEQGAFIDQTGINDKINFIFNKSWNFEEAKEHLKAFGLELSRSYRNMNVVVIKDSTD